LNTTPISLLERVQQRGDEAAWRQFVDLYSPLLCQWGRRAGLQEADLADVVQDVFATLVRVLPEFEYDPQKSFRAWLKTVQANRCRKLAAARRELAHQGPVEEIPAPEFPDPLSDVEYRSLLVASALRVAEASFEPVTFRAAHACLIEHKAATAVAAELGLSVNSVYLAKSRLLKKLREVLAGILEEVDG
jgi:RNA polymerase sigma-70 factor (ECF subfamily)